MNTTTKPDAMPDLPADLKRDKKPATPQVPAMPGTAPLGVKPTGRVLPSLKSPEQPVAPKAKASKPKAKAVREPKTSARKPSHKPSEVQSTERNPAKSIVPPSFKARYAEHNDSNGDRVALALAAFVHGVNADGRPATDLVKLRQVAKDNGIDYSRYEGLNVGQQRMNVGNRLRGILKAGKPVVIGKQRFANAETALKVQPGKAKAA